MPNLEVTLNAPHDWPSCAREQFVLQSAYRGLIQETMR